MICWSRGCVGAHRRVWQPCVRSWQGPGTTGRWLRGEAVGVEPWSQARAIPSLGLCRLGPSDRRVHTTRTCERLQQWWGTCAHMGLNQAHRTGLVVRWRRAARCMRCMPQHLAVSRRPRQSHVYGPQAAPSPALCVTQQAVNQHQCPAIDAELRDTCRGSAWCLAHHLAHLSYPNGTHGPKHT